MSEPMTEAELHAAEIALWKQYRKRKRDGYFRGVAFNAFTVPRWFFWPLGYVKFGGSFIPRNQLASMIAIVNDRLKERGSSLVLTLDNYFGYERAIAACK